MRRATPIFGLVIGALCLAGVAPAEQARLPQGCLVLRLSSQAISDVQQQSFENEQKIEDLVLDTKVKGLAKTTGKCKLESMRQEGGDKILRLVVEGTSVTTSEGRHGPAIIRSTTTTDFVAEAPVAFERDKGFAAGEVSVKAKSKTTTDDIDSTQGGIAGAVVKKIAAKKVAASMEEAQAIARDLAIKRIQSEIEAELDRRLAKLNESYRRMLPVLSALKEKSRDIVSMAADEKGLTVLVSKAENASAIAGLKLPALQAAIELWLPNDGGTPKLAAQQGSDKFAVSIAGQEKKATPALARYEQWWIVRLGADE
jgi:hypothetical protein